MLFQVATPHIYHEAIIKYLIKYDLVRKEEVTFTQLCDATEFKDSDAVVKMILRSYTVNGVIKGAQKQVYISIYEYGRFLCQYIELAKKEDVFDLFFQGNISSLDEVFTFGMINFFDDDTGKEKRESMKKVFHVMLVDHASLGVHIDLVQACRHSPWSLRQLLHFLPTVFQLPFDNEKTYGVSKNDGIYGYHIYSYVVTHLRTIDDGDDARRDLLKRIRAYTPVRERQMFDLLKAEKKEIIKKLFPNVIIKKEVKDAKVVYDYDSNTEDDEEVIEENNNKVIEENNNPLFQTATIRSSRSL